MTYDTGQGKGFEFMNILAIDTSTKYFCLAIANADKILTSFCEPLGRDLSRLIMPIISQQLKVAKLAISEIGCFAVGLGSGSFTGLRIGVSTIKGFCLGLNKPAVGISSLDLIARNARCNYEADRIKQSCIVCPIIDAKRLLVYSAIYTSYQLSVISHQFGKNKLKLKSRYFLMPIKELLRNFSSLSAGRVRERSEKVVFLGDGIFLYRAEIEKKLGVRAVFLEEQFWYPRPENLFNLAKEKIVKKEWMDARKIVPVYLYPKECQVNKSS